MQDLSSLSLSLPVHFVQIQGESSAAMANALDRNVAAFMAVTVNSEMTETHVSSSSSDFFDPKCPNHSQLLNFSDCLICLGSRIKTQFLTIPQLSKAPAVCNLVGKSVDGKNPIPNHRLDV